MTEYVKHVIKNASFPALMYEVEAMLQGGWLICDEEIPSHNLFDFEVVLIKEAESDVTAKKLTPAERMAKARAARFKK